MNESGRAFAPLSVFVSYKRSDEETYGLVGQLKRHLPHRFSSHTGDRLSLFVDTGMAGGVEWKKSIKEAAASSDFMLCLLSVEYLCGEHCRNEVSWFLDSREASEKGVSILPIPLIDPAVLTKYCPREGREVLERLARLNWVDGSPAIDSAYAGPEWQIFLRRLVNDSLVPAWERKRDRQQPL
ncbi:MAG TPA: toll/interleukin-1 receptor domain-containing protein [Arachnia sp.]|nr:toll/interleukin-1 receptor domain-containing protein [Arachnia sp.]HMT86305.1 toll/interleukin-1 receptor domain-containing protein [Arachnia sp.]